MLRAALKQDSTLDAIDETEPIARLESGYQAPKLEIGKCIKCTFCTVCLQNAMIRADPLSVGKALSLELYKSFVFFEHVMEQLSACITCIRSLSAHLVANFGHSRLRQ